MDNKKKIIIAKTAGFCMGVKRAVDMVMDIIDRVPGPVYSLGPLIHNPQVTQLLEDKGIVILPEGKIPEGGTVVIRAHGISPVIYQKLEKAADNICDATCPFVVKVQHIIKIYSQKGYMVVIAGDQGHAEVGSYLGYAGGKGVVISTIEDAREFVEGSRITEDKICIVAQTTFDREMFNVIVNQFRAKGSKPRVFNTICSATVKRQKEAMLISRLADVMIVVGGKNSANTGRLAQICRNSGKKTYYIERPEELDPEVLKDCRIIGITAGASTSKSTIESVTGYIDEKINQSKEE